MMRLSESVIDALDKATYVGFCASPEVFLGSKAKPTNSATWLINAAGTPSMSVRIIFKDSRTCDCKGVRYSMSAEYVAALACCIASRSKVNNRRTRSSSMSA